MTASHTGIAARRLVFAAGFACLLAGCNQTGTAQQAAYPFDYRERHPITLKEGQQTVQIFLGRNRGGLSPIQRADVLSFAQQWRREATSEGPACRTKNHPRVLPERGRLLSEV